MKIVPGKTLELKTASNSPARYFIIFKILIIHWEPNTQNVWGRRTLIIKAAAQFKDKFKLIILTVGSNEEKRFVIKYKN